MKENLRTFGFKSFAFLSLMIIGLSITAHAQVPSYIYGINDNNEIAEVDMVSKTTRIVYTTSLTGVSNAFAYDNARNHFIFLDNSKTLFYWDRGSELRQVATSSQIGSPTTLPANAAYYNNAYWFFNEGTHTLNKVSLTYTSGQPTFSSLTQYGITNSSLTAANNRFGDIVINAAGKMYAMTAAGPGGVFYSIDLTTLVATLTPTSLQNVATLISASTIDPENSDVIGLQIGFNSNQTAMFGHNYANGKWYEVNMTTGALTYLSFISSFPTTGLRDIGDNSDETPAVLADLSITITDNRSNYTPGGTLTYVIVVTNNSGTVSVPGAIVNNLQPSGITYGNWTVTYSGGASSANGSGSINNYSLANLPPGSTATFTISATVGASTTGNQTSTATVTSPPDYADPTPSNNTATDTDALPLTWGGFTVSLATEGVKLAWTTLMEQNTKDFVIQRSQNGQIWNDIGNVTAAGNSSTSKKYTYLDRTVTPGSYQYRILQRDLDGKSSVSVTRIVKVNAGNETVTILGNPVTNGILKLSIRERSEIIISDALGRLVYKAALESGMHNIQTTNWKKGTYGYRIIGNAVTTGHLVIQ